MEHIENNDPCYKAYRNQKPKPASQSTSKNAPSGQVRKSLEVFAQPRNRFQIPDRAAAARGAETRGGWEIYPPNNLTVSPPIV